MSKKYLKSSIPFGLALVTFIIGLFFNSHRGITEMLYTHSVYPKLATILSFISSVVPFSLFDTIIVTMIFLFFSALVLLFMRKIKIRLFLLRLFQLLCIVYGLFYWLWGFNYYRQGAEERLGLTTAQVDTVQFKKVLISIIDEVNQNYINVDTFNVYNAAQINESSFQRMADRLDLDYPCGTRRVKFITFSSFYAKATIGGYFGPFFNEVHVNKYLPKWDVPMTVAHEMSHQFGVTSEAEANFYAWLVCINSEDQFTRYSGWLYALVAAFRQAGAAMDVKPLVKELKPEVIADAKARNEYWRNMVEKKINKVARKMNDAYLKTNNIEKGIDDYNGMVQLIMDVYESKRKDILPANIKTGS